MVSRQFTEEESRRVENYTVGDYVKFRTDYKTTELSKGELYKVEGIDGDEVIVSSMGGRTLRFNPALYKDKDVFYGQKLDIAKGDKLRWTASEKAIGRLNGKALTVTAINKQSMEVVDQKGVTHSVSLSEPIHVDSNWVSTSYRAQGQSVLRVIVSATNDPTSSREPFYVKISRQKLNLSVYTENLEQLRKWVEKSNAQPNALDLIQESNYVSSSNDHRATDSRDITEANGVERKDRRQNNRADGTEPEYTRDNLERGRRAT
ncbi:MAG: hypothetical protein ACRCYP_05225, partial [Alphaproteobacteria bacterium]